MTAHRTCATEGCGAFVPPDTAYCERCNLKRDNDRLTRDRAIALEGLTEIANSPYDDSKKIASYTISLMEG